MSPRIATVCAMPYCPVATKGNYCTRHRDMTPEQEAAETREMRRRAERFHELHDEARRLRDADDPEALAEAEAAAEEARLYLAELFGEPVEEGQES